MRQFEREQGTTKGGREEAAKDRAESSKGDDTSTLGCMFEAIGDEGTKASAYIHQRCLWTNAPCHNERHKRYYQRTGNPLDIHPSFFFHFFEDVYLFF